MPSPKIAKLRRNYFVNLDNKQTEARALEIWHLRMAGMSVPEIAKKFKINPATVQDALKRATDVVKERCLVDAETVFEQAQEQINSVMAICAERIKDSVRPRLNFNLIADDIASGVIKPFLVERYFTKAGRPKPSVFAADWDVGSPELQAVTDYIEPGRLDLEAVKRFQSASESKRKLLGLDRDKHRVEVSGKDGGAVELRDVFSEINEITARRRQMIAEAKDDAG